MATLATFVGEVIEVIGAVAGIRDAPDQPPEQLGQDITAVVYSTEGRAEFEATGWLTTYDQVTVGVFVPLNDLPRRNEEMLPFRELIPTALFTALRSGDFSEVSNFDTITHRYGPFQWGGVDVFGYLFTISDVKLQTVI
jgi:hypothetical protein